MLDKRARTHMALACGADLVLELPVVYSSHNALLFANGAVDILAAAGVVGSISFGMETPDIGMLVRLAEVLNDESKEFRTYLREALDAGRSFVQARGIALDALIPGSLGFLKRSNNNLALSYLKRIKEMSYPIEPFAVERVGAGYHDAGIGSGDIASATAIRAALGRGELEAALSAMPSEAAGIFSGALEEGHIAGGHDRYWRQIKQAILRAPPEELSSIAEMSEGLHNRMEEMAWRCGSLDAFADSCTSRRYTRGRILRYCAHLLIGLDHRSSRNFQEKGPAYIRVLGANGSGRELLKKMRKTATLPVISRSSAPFSDYASRMMGFEHRATELWELLTDNPRQRREARYIPVMI